jgi:hypothetical protein
VDEHPTSPLTAARQIPATRVAVGELLSSGPAYCIERSFYDA